MESLLSRVSFFGSLAQRKSGVVTWRGQGFDYLKTHMNLDGKRYTLRDSTKSQRKWLREVITPQMRTYAAQTGIFEQKDIDRVERELKDIDRIK